MTRARIIRRHSTGAALAALLLLIVGQIGVSAHEATHAFDSVEHCEACLQIDRDDDVVVDDPVAASFIGAGVAPEIFATGRTPARIPDRQNARAPPALG